MYGVDIEDDRLLERRSWRWLASRISGLLDRPLVFTPDGRAVHSTRLGLALFPPQTRNPEE